MAAVKSDTAAVLADTGTDGVVVAAGSKTGYTLTATTGLGGQGEPVVRGVIDRQTERLTLHEKAILALASGLYIVAQERFPAIAGLIREILSK